MPRAFLYKPIETAHLRHLHTSTTTHMFSIFLSSHPPVIRAVIDASLGWLLLSIARALWNQSHVSSLLRHVPGPKAPSWLWGSEWQVHESAPGAPYIEWKQQYGDVVKYKGALGVSIIFPTLML